MIKIYTKNNCMPCKMTKNWFKNNGLRYVEHNVDDDTESFNYLMANNLRTLPVVFNDDELLAMGFQPHKLKHLLINRRK